MATCNDCIYRPKCISFIVHGMGDNEINGGLLTDMDKRCKDFKNKTDVIVPPCKVGDTVYIKNRPLIISFLHIDENSISFVVQFDCDDCYTCPFYEDYVSFEGEHDCKTMGYIEFTEEDIGKTVFLTKEEAELKLKEYE